VSEKGFDQRSEATEQGELRGLEGPEPKRSCIHHQKDLILYCESCEEPICDQCSTLGPHNNQLHRINNIEGAFRSRAVATHQVISGSMIGKRDQLIGQVHRIDHRLEEIKHVKNVIERDIRGEFGGMIERLKGSEGIKLAVLQHEISHLQRDVDKINDIVNVVNELTGEKGDPIDFLLRSRHLTETIEFTVAKPFKTTIDVVPYDLPRELGEQREKIDKTKVVQDILAMKDKVIFELIKKYKTEEEKVAAEMNKAAQEEIDEWSKLTDRFASELKRYHMICYYCGCVLDDRNVNNVCEQNNRTQLPANFGFTIETPAREWHGTRRHFYSQPKPELVKGGKIAEMPISDYELVSKNPNDERAFKSQYQMFLEVLLAKIRKYCAEQKIEVEKLFLDHDKEHKGYINHITLTFLLHEYCAVDPIEIEKLKQILDPNVRNQIKYGELIKMINDPKYLNDFKPDGPLQPEVTSITKRRIY
jgi:palmitoyltransferase